MTPIPVEPSSAPVPAKPGAKPPAKAPAKKGQKEPHPLLLPEQDEEVHPYIAASTYLRVNAVTYRPLVPVPKTPRKARPQNQ